MNDKTLLKQYKLIKNDMDWKNNVGRCQAILETTYAILNKDHWKVIGITKAAVGRIVKNNYRIHDKNHRMIICRAHIHQRRDTFLHIMNYNKWKNGEEIYNYMKKMDKCLIATKKENNNESKLKKHKSIPKNLFRTKSIGFTFRKEERKWLKDNF